MPLRVLCSIMGHWFTVLLRVSWPWAGIASVIRNPDAVSPHFRRSVISPRHCVTYMWHEELECWVHKLHLPYPIQFTSLKSGAEWRRLAGLRKIRAWNVSFSATPLGVYGDTVRVASLLMTPEDSPRRQEAICLGYDPVDNQSGSTM